MSRVTSRTFNLKLNERGIREPLGRINGDMSEFAKSMDAANARVIAFGASTAVLFKMGQAFKSLISTAIEVEKKLIDINTIFQLSNRGLNQFSGDLFKVAKLTAQSYDTVAEAAKEYSRQGLSSEETIRRTRDAMVLLRQSGLDAGNAVAHLTAIMNVYGEEVKNTSNIVNKLSNVDAAFAVSTADLVEAFSRAGFSAKEAGVNFEQFASLVTVAQQNTARGGAVIGNAFKTIFARITTKDTLTTMQQLGANFQDVNGKTLDGIRLLQQYVTRYNELKREGNLTGANELTQKIGGIRQMNILLATAKGLTGEAGPGSFEEVMKVAGEASNRAMQRNAEMNKSVQDMFAQTKVDLTEISKLTMQIGGMDSIKTYLKQFEKFTGIIKDVLGNGEDTGNAFAKGIVSSVGKVLAGPGMAAVLGIVFGLIGKSGKFVFGAFKDLIGLNKSLNEQRAIQEAINQLLARDGELRSKINSGALTQIQQEKLITQELRLQIAERMKMNSITNSLSYSAISNGIKFKGGQIATKNLAEGYLPIDKEKSDISHGIGGARAGDKPIIISDFNFGGGEKGIAVANSGEWLVRNYGGTGIDAIINRKNIERTGLPPDARKLGFANGFIPNFADGFDPSLEKIVNSVRSPEGRFISSELKNSIRVRVNQALAAINNYELGAMSAFEGGLSGELNKKYKLNDKTVPSIKQEFRSSINEKSLQGIRSILQNRELNIKRRDETMGKRPIPTSISQESPLFSATITEKAIKKNLENISNEQLRSLSGQNGSRNNSINNIRGNFTAGPYSNMRGDAFSDNYVSKITGLARARTFEEQYVEKIKYAVSNGENLNKAIISASEGFLGSGASRGKMRKIAEKTTNSLVEYDGSLIATRKQLEERVKIEGAINRIQKGLGTTEDKTLYRNQVERQLLSSDEFGSGRFTRKGLGSILGAEFDKKLEERMSYTESPLAPPSSPTGKRSGFIGRWMGGNSEERMLAAQQNQFYAGRISEKNRFGFGAGWVLDENGERAKGDVNSRSMRSARNKINRGGGMSSFASFGLPIGLSMAAGAAESMGMSSAVSGGLQGAGTGAMMGSFTGNPLGIAAGAAIGGLIGSFGSLKSSAEKSAEAVDKMVQSLQKSSENYSSLIDLNQQLQEANETGNIITRRRIEEEIKYNELKMSPSENSQYIDLLKGGKTKQEALVQMKYEKEKESIRQKDSISLQQTLSKLSSSKIRQALVDPTNENRPLIESAISSAYAALRNQIDFSDLADSLEKYQTIFKNYMDNPLEDRYGVTYVKSRPEMSDELSNSISRLGAGELARTDKGRAELIAVLRLLISAGEEGNVLTKELISNTQSTNNITNNLNKFLANLRVQEIESQSKSQIFQATGGYRLQSLQGFVSNSEYGRQDASLKREKMQIDVESQKFKLFQSIVGENSSQIFKKTGIATPTEKQANIVSDLVQEYSNRPIEDYQKFAERLQASLSSSAISSILDEKLKTGPEPGENGNDWIRNSELPIGNLSEEDLRNFAENIGSPEQMKRFLTPKMESPFDSEIFRSLINSSTEEAKIFTIQVESQKQLLDLEIKNIEKQNILQDRKEKFELQLSREIQKRQSNETIRSGRVGSVLSLKESELEFNSRYMTSQEMLPQRKAALRERAKEEIRIRNEEYQRSISESSKSLIDYSLGSGRADYEAEMLMKSKSPEDTVSIIKESREGRAKILEMTSGELSAPELQLLTSISEKQYQQEEKILSTIESQSQIKDELNRKTQENVDNLQKQLDLEERYRQSVSSGMESSFAKMKEMSTNSAAMGETIVNSFSGGMNSFMDKIVNLQNPGKAALGSILEISEGIRKQSTQMVIGSLMGKLSDNSKNEEGTGYKKGSLLSGISHLFGGDGSIIKSNMSPEIGLATSGANSALGELMVAAQSAASALKLIGGGEGEITGQSAIDGESSLWGSIREGVSNAWSSIFGSGKKDGGVVGYALGGKVNGVDNIPAMLSEGEYVVNRHAAKAIGYSALNGLNHYASGGAVSFNGYSGDLLSAIDAKKSVSIKKDYESQMAGLQGSGMSQKFWHGNSPAARAYWAKESEMFNLYKKKLAEREARRKELRNLAISTAVDIGMSYAGNRFNNYMNKRKLEKMAMSAGNGADLSEYNQLNGIYSIDNLMKGSSTKDLFSVRHATGGLIDSGNYGIDKVPAMVTRGEYVIKKSVVDRLGSQYFDNINKYSSGGLVSSTSNNSTSTSSSSIKMEFNINGNNSSSSVETTQKTINEKELQNAIQQAAQSEIRKQLRVSGVLRGANR
jgi:TP901 family phage tail tape measure protein